MLAVQTMHIACGLPSKPTGQDIRSICRCAYLAASLQQGDNVTGADCAVLVQPGCVNKVALAAQMQPLQAIHLRLTSGIVICQVCCCAEVCTPAVMVTASAVAILLFASFG